MAAAPPLDPYKVLGVSKDAQIPEIRSAHRKLILKCHPDKVQDAALKAKKQDEFQQVQRAYEMLSDDNERQKYDDQVRLAELRTQFKKANISSPRPKYTAEFEIRTAEPRPGFQPGPPPRTFTTFTRAFDEDVSQRAYVYDAEPRSSRRSHNSPKPSRREMERERERDSDREQRDRERRRREEANRRAERDAKEARRAEQRAREKKRDKTFRRESDDKRKYAQPFVEDDDDMPPPRFERKKSSRMYEEARERSSHREEVPMAPPPPSRIPANLDYAESYTGRKDSGKGKGGPSLVRSATYHAARNTKPPVPTPPPAGNVDSPFPAPGDVDEVPRSSARRGSAGSQRHSRERPHRSSSSEDMIPEVVDVSPRERHMPTFPKSASSTPHLSNSPPRISRTYTMPAEPPTWTRAIPGMRRAETFSHTFREQSDPRGRNRSRGQSQQVPDESDSDDYDYEYERRRERERDRKHRSSRKTYSPDPPPRRADHSRSKSHNHARTVEVDPYQQSSYFTNGVRVVESRHTPVRESNYPSHGGTARFHKVKMSKEVTPEDISFSQHYPRHQTHHEAYPVY